MFSAVSPGLGPGMVGPMSDQAPPDGAVSHQASATELQFLDPQKLLRIAGVTREVLEEARRIRPVQGAVDHLRRVHGQIENELKEALPGELYQELEELTPDIRDGSLEELALAHAEILGWLEGLFQGTHLAIQMQAAQALQRRVPGRLPGQPPPEAGPDGGEDRTDSRYL
jgi:hypothetical protein